MGDEPNEPMSPRRRALVVLAALVAAALIAVGIVVVLADDADTPTVEGGGATKEARGFDQLGEADAFVAFPADASEAQWQRLRSALDDSEIVERYLELPYGWWSVLQLSGESFLGRLPADLYADCPRIVSPGLLINAADAQAERIDEFDALIAPARRVVDDFMFERGLANGVPHPPELFMDVDATAQQVEAIRAELGADPEIEGVEHLTKDDAFDEFQRIFADDPDVLDGIERDGLPESFRLDVVDGADLDALFDRYTGRSGVDEVVISSWDDAEFAIDEPPVISGGSMVELEIFMDVDADRTHVDAVEDALNSNSGVRSFEHFSKDEAYAEYVRLFAGQPDLVDGVSPDALPESFRVVLAGDPGVIVDEFASMASVDEVVGAGVEGQFVDLCPAVFGGP